MKIKLVLLSVFACLLFTPRLQAGEVILYGSTQNAGKLKFSTVTEIPENLLEGGRGSAFGIRLSSGGVFGYEQNISYSPRFAKKEVKAFQMDSNLLIQAPGKVVPYATAGIGFIVTWGPDFPDDKDPEKMAAAAFSFGTKFSLNYGGGIKLRRILGPLGFGFDLRGFTVPNARDGALHFTQMSFGAVFTW
jgi:hypothetical protein